MPRTLDEGFKDFLTKLTPSLTETTSAKSHRKSIESCLESNFNMVRFFRTGSFGNGTSISGFSDVDYFASIPRANLNANSSNTLIKVRSALSTRFPTTGVHIDCPAVKLPFGSADWESTEVVPADCMKITDGHLVYDIPDCAGGWMKSSPDAHNAYVDGINKKLNFKLKHLIRFIKAWKYYQNVPISSFYLELRVAKYASSQTSIIYDIDIMYVLSHLINIGLAQMQDPMGISGYIAPASTQNKINDALSKLNTAYTRAEKAYNARKEGKISDAFYWWNLLFDSKFPNYYY